MPNMTRSTQVALAARQGNFEGLKHILDNGKFTIICPFFTAILSHSRYFGHADQEAWYASVHRSATKSGTFVCGRLVMQTLLPRHLPASGDSIQ